METSIPEMDWMEKAFLEFTILMYPYSYDFKSVHLSSHLLDYPVAFFLWVCVCRDNADMDLK